jgi:hypothetical protein
MRAAPTSVVITDSPAAGSAIVRIAARCSASAASKSATAICSSIFPNVLPHSRCILLKPPPQKENFESCRWRNKHESYTGTNTSPTIEGRVPKFKASDDARTIETHDRRYDAVAAARSGCDGKIGAAFVHGDPKSSGSTRRFRQVARYRACCAASVRSRAWRMCFATAAG